MKKQVTLEDKAKMTQMFDRGYTPAAVQSMFGTPKGIVERTHKEYLKIKGEQHRQLRPRGLFDGKP